MANNPGLLEVIKRLLNAETYVRWRETLKRVMPNVRRPPKNQMQRQVSGSGALRHFRGCVAALRSVSANCSSGQRLWLSATSPGMPAVFVLGTLSPIPTSGATRGPRDCWPQADGTAIRPAITRALVWTPERLLQAGLRRFLDTELAVVGGQAHALAAVDEMRELADELRAILRRTGVRSPANDQAYQAISDWAGGMSARGG